MAQCHGCRLSQMIACNLKISGECCQGARRAHERELAANTVCAERHTQARRRLENDIGDVDRGNARSCCNNRGARPSFILGESRDESLWIALERIAPFDDFDTGLDVVWRLDLHGEAEPVQKLRSELTFLRIAAADEHEARRMTDAQSVAFENVDAGGGHVDQQINQMILEQVDLVDVEEPAIGARQQTRLEGLDAIGQSPFEIETAKYAILGCTEGQVDHGDRRVGSSMTAVALCLAGRALRRRVRIATEWAADNDLDEGQQGRQRPHGGRFTCTAIAQSEHTADCRVDGSDRQCGPHLLLADDCRKWVGSLRCSGNGNVLARACLGDLEAPYPRLESDVHGQAVLRLRLQHCVISCSIGRQGYAANWAVSFGMSQRTCWRTCCFSSAPPGQFGTDASARATSRSR